VFLFLWLSFTIAYWFHVLQPKKQKKKVSRRSNEVTIAGHLHPVFIKPILFSWYVANKFGAENITENFVVPRGKALAVNDIRTRLCTCYWQDRYGKKKGQPHPFRSVHTETTSTRYRQQYLYPETCWATE
jgi:hypothetical protein